MKKLENIVISALLATIAASLTACTHNIDSSTHLKHPDEATQARVKMRLDEGWRFFKYPDDKTPDSLVYDVRPDYESDEDGKAADAKPTEAVSVTASKASLKPWILPTANAFILDANQHYKRPPGNPGADFPFVQSDFNDSQWQTVTVPHDWAISGPFFAGEAAPVGGGMGRLPSPGVAWYRNSIAISKSNIDQNIFLDIDGAMSYAMVWLNGHLVGGWPYGYASWRLDLTPYINFGEENQLAIRVDNPPASSRWYPGGGLFRNVWITKTNKTHVSHWGTKIETSNVGNKQANVKLTVGIDNKQANAQIVSVLTDVFLINQDGTLNTTPAASYKPNNIKVLANSQKTVVSNVTIINPKLWGPKPNQTPHQYVAVTRIMQGDQILDQYETKFGIRDLIFDADNGLFVNGERVYLQGVNQHHDLGALGAAFNVRAAERQLQLLQEMGVNAIRMAHNPPASELLDLTDRMGLLVIDEIFDVWERKKTPLDFHLIFPEWHEADLRSFIRRDRNHPSIVMWSIGNEVGEQYTGHAGAAVAQQLQTIAKQEDPTRPTAASFNFAKPNMPLPAVMDSISLNYQGEGIRNAPAYAHLDGIRTKPLYPAFKSAFPNKMIISSENAAALSSRGEYLFPVTPGISAPVADGSGGDPVTNHVSSYELYTAPFGSSADKVLSSLKQHPYVAGGFIWSGWDYLGEPTPYYSARSSYFGVIDLAGFKKDRFYLYQSEWRPNFPMVHILPHWNWPDRMGKTTPVHVFTSGDEAELFINGRSMGRKQKASNDVRLRWDNIKYQPGEVIAVAYKNGQTWATNRVKTTGNAHQISLSSDTNNISSDGQDLSFITVKVEDEHGLTVPNAKHNIQFSITGPGEIVATDNGDPTSLIPFTSTKRRVFNGLGLVIVKAKKSHSGSITIFAHAKGLTSASTVVTTQP